MLARLLIVLAVATPGLQTACDGTTPPAPAPAPDVSAPSPFDDRPDTGEVFTSQDGQRIRVQPVVTGLEIPWALAFTPDGRLFVTERPGRVRVVEDGRLRPTPALTLSDVHAQGEGGLLGLAIDPEFEQNHFVYLLYTAARRGRPPVNRIVRYLEARSTLLDGVTLLDDIPAHAIHDGGRLRFGPDGHLYATMGDVADRFSAQDLGVATGKILRLGRDGTAPPDNPFASFVYSYGHRNPQGIDWHPQDGSLWASEHGNVGNDEVNRIEPGANYGWPVIEGASTRRGMRAPVLFFTPSIAPSGASFYRGTLWPGFRHDLFIATLRGRHLLRVRFAADDPTDVTGRERLLEGRFGRLRDVVTGPDGALYVGTNNRDGRGTPQPGDDRILRLVPAP